MMEKVILRGTSYHFVKDFKHIEALRLSFNSMTETHFGFTLEAWYQAGYWGDYYVPYALIHENEIVANVSINKLEFIIDNQPKLGIQVGTVMTDEKFRHRGLSKYLLQRVMQDWERQADFIYLFANDTVLDFYPKFGFERVEEYQYSKSFSSKREKTLRQLNFDNQKDIELLISKINESVPISKISLRNHAAMILFYAMTFMKDSFYSVPECNAIVVADFEGNTMLLHEVFSEASVDLDHLISTLAGPTIEKVVLGFTPMDTSGFSKSLLQTPDVLFMLKNQSDFFTKDHRMFPALSHA